MQLREIIIQRIKDEGPISFHDYMEMALYYPKLGYYTNSNEKTGKHGDYYTSAYVTTIFGAMIGRQLEEMWRITGEEDFTIVEYGAGSGMLCHDILSYLSSNKKMYAKLSYCIIEKSPYMREKERSILYEKVSWLDSITDIHDVTGCILSNELLDNFSVHEVIMKDELKEVHVDYTNKFNEILLPAPVKLKNYFKQEGISLSPGFRTEINMEAEDWIKDISSVLKKGFVLTIDYGYPAADFFDDSRRYGTLLCYYKHAVNNCLYDNIGEQDITSHVNFSSLYKWGLANGLEYCGFINQAKFLLSLGFTGYLNQLEKTTDAITEPQKQFLLQTFLMDMGRKFKVLIQRKGLPAVRLTGLQFC